MKSVQGRPVAVLVVDDSLQVRRRLCEKITEETSVQIVAQAGSAREALHAFQQLRPDAVILDMGLPDASGMEVLRQIKQATPLCFVIVLTQYDEPMFAELARTLGADCFFHKSTEFERVAEVLRALAIEQ
jgi:DNA-binding NarL/FixJ family response regulator